jgi:hypothetical protein
LLFSIILRVLLLRLNGDAGIASFGMVFFNLQWESYAVANNLIGC